MPRRRQAEASGGCGGVFGVLLFFGALLSGAWWAWLIVVIFAVAIGIAIYAGLRAPVDDAEPGTNPHFAESGDK